LEKLFSIYQNSSRPAVKKHTRDHQRTHALSLVTGDKEVSSQSNWKTRPNAPSLLLRARGLWRCEEGASADGHAPTTTQRTLRAGRSHRRRSIGSAPTQAPTAVGGLPSSQRRSRSIRLFAEEVVPADQLIQLVPTLDHQLPVPTSDRNLSSTAAHSLLTKVGQTSNMEQLQIAIVRGSVREKNGR